MPFNGVYFLITIYFKIINAFFWTYHLNLAKNNVPYGPSSRSVAT